MKVQKVKTSNIIRHLNKVATQLNKTYPTLHYSFDGLPHAVGDKICEDIKKNFGIKKFDEKFLKVFQGVFMNENDRVGNRYGFTHSNTTTEETLTKAGVSQKEQLVLGIIDVMLGYIVKEVNPQQYSMYEQQARELELCEMFGVSSLNELDFPVVFF